LNNNTNNIDMKSGIYKITNATNGKLYIGQSKRIDRRKREHLKKLVSNQHYNDHLQGSFNKYGLENFNFEVIEFCEDHQLDEKENYFINKYDSMDREKGYNLKKGGNKIILSDYSKKKISETRKQRIKDGSIKTVKIIFTDEIKRKISDGIKRSYKENPELLLCLSEARSTIHIKTVEIIKTMLYNDFDIKFIAKETGVSVDKINHISNLNSFKHVLIEHNYYIKNRHTIQQCRQSKKVLAMYREGMSYSDIGEMVQLHHRNVIRIVNKNKTDHDDRCRLNCINRAFKKQYSTIKTLKNMGKGVVEISRFLNFAKSQVCKLLNSDGPNLVKDLQCNRGRIKPFKLSFSLNNNKDDPLSNR